MTLGEMKAEVALGLGNMKAGDPYFASIEGWVKRAAFRLVQLSVGSNRGNLNQFPELLKGWDIVGPDAVPAEVPYPADMLVLTDVFSYDEDDAGIVGVNPPRARELSYYTPKEFEELDRTEANWPRYWTRQNGRKIRFGPIPSVEFKTYFRFHGIKRPEFIGVGDAAVLDVDEQWHDVVVTLASAIGAARRGWATVAAAHKATAMQELGLSADLTALEEMHLSEPTVPEGLPTQGIIYG